jgi:predicted ATPase/class 3 adenylate cyclase
MSRLPTGTITFVFTDIEGSTELWERCPEAMRQTLAQHDTCLRAAIEDHGGHVFKTIGDAFCAAFARATDSLHAAIAVQQRVRALQLSPASAAAEIALKVRVALHTGAAEERENDYFGSTLSRVKRLLDVGHGGQVLLSQTTRDLVQNDLPPGVSLRDLGVHRLRHLLRPEHIYQLLHPDLPADFAPLRSIRILSHNLPQQVTRFVGREREMVEIKQYLATTRLLTLTGTGGAGKTRLALQVTAELFSQYEDGIWLVELAALADPALVPEAVATALAARPEPGRALTQTLVEALQPRQLLLILDNCEHLLAACACLVHTLLQTCPHLRVLATSRERLNIPGEQTYRVPSLTTPDPNERPATLVGPELVAAMTQFEAVQMFIDRAALVEPGFSLTGKNAAAVAQVCHRLDGIPLAIELAVARLKVLSVEQMAPRLNDIFRLLPVGSPAALPRQQTLRALIDWSYDLLSEAERTLLGRLSVFVGGFTLEAAEAVTGGEVEGGGHGEGIEPDAVLDLLGQLVEKSLVLADEEEGGRYQLQETIRQYASEKLWEAGEGVIARFRYRGWFLQFAERALAQSEGAGRATSLQQLVTEYDNLRSALGPAARAHPKRDRGGERDDLPLHAPRLARWGRVVQGLVTAFRRLGRREGALGLLEDYLILCQTEDNAPCLARAYTLKGTVLKIDGGRSAAASSQEMYERAIALCEARGLPDWIAQAQSHLAYDLAEAGVNLERAEALARASLGQGEPEAPDPQWWGGEKPKTVVRRTYGALMWFAMRRADWAAFKGAFQASLAWGGPYALPLTYMLEHIEARHQRQGTAAEFRDLCRYLEAEYARAGLETPLQQWYLEPATSLPLPGALCLQEEFEGEGLHASLQWQDSTERSRMDQVARPGWLGLYPAEQCDLWPGTNFNAPRLVATVEGDYVAQTCVELGQPINVFAGLVVWSDEQHFARLELRPYSQHEARVTLEACVGGEFRPIGRGQCGQHRMWLRFERIGDDLRGLCSADGEEWMDCGTVRLPRRDPEQVGLVAIFQGPGAHAWFDTFLLWGETGVDEATREDAER